jgi:hypothetical protein
LGGGLVTQDRDFGDFNFNARGGTALPLQRIGRSSLPPSIMFGPLWSGASVKTAMRQSVFGWRLRLHPCFW